MLPRKTQQADECPFFFFFFSSVIRSNVVAAGSAVVNCLLPVPEEYNGSKRALREFYHEKFCPASDVDLFLYGLTEEQAIEKLSDIETRVRDALLTESTVVRTKHAITICLFFLFFFLALSPPPRLSDKV